jgi:hypothetical protein
MRTSKIVGMHKAILAVLAVVMIAGCVGQTVTTSTTSPGLAITSLTADVNEQASGRTIRMFGEFENQGESKIIAANSLVTLIGPTGHGLLQWGDVPNAVATFRRDLNPADVARDLPAGRDTMQWKVIAPRLDPGQRKIDTFTVRAYYDYQTKGVGNLMAYSEAEATAVREGGDTLEKGAFSTTRGPISLSVRSVPDPVIVVPVTAGGAATETVTLEIVISNVGGGTVYRVGKVKGADTVIPALQFDDLNKVNVMVDTELPESGTSCKSNVEQELIGGKPTTITCDFTINLNQPKQSYPVKVNATYGYYTEQNVQLTAIGQR